MKNYVAYFMVKGKNCQVDFSITAGGPADEKWTAKEKAKDAYPEISRDELKRIRIKEI